MGDSGIAITGPAGKRKPTFRFTTFHRADRTFFLLFLAACWLGVAMGFTPAIAKRMHGAATYPAPLILQLHAFAFVGWMGLLSIQTLLVRTLRQRQHMALGLVGFLLVPAMLLTGYFSERYGQRFRFDHHHNDLAFFIVALFYLAFFGVLATAALAMRKTPAAHKRLIVLATTIIVGAAYARWWGEPLYEAYGDGFWGFIINTFTGTNLLLLAAVAYDLATRRQVNRVLMLGVPSILAGELATSYLYHAPGWLPIAQAIIGR